MNRIQHCIRVLCPSGDYAAAAQAYFTARLIIAYAPGGDYHTALRISEPLQHALYQYRDIVSSALTEEQADVWCEFCGELSRTGLDADHRTFFQTVTPGAVLQWDALARALSSNRIGEQLVALCLILRDAPPASLGVSQDWLRQHYDAVGATYHRIHLSYAQYAECWHAVHHAGLADSSHAPGGAIVQAMRLYHSLQLPMTDLLSDYAALYLEQGAAARRIATRGARRRSPTAPVAEGGRSEQDRELEHRLLALAQEAPTDAVRGLFYPPVRNDAGFECTFLLQQFYGAATPRDRVLVVNPSPDMICHMMRDRMACNRLLFLVADETLASLYARQFGCDIFVAPAALDSRSCQYDRILLTSRDQPVEPLLECLRWAAPGTRVTALIPETSLQTVHSHLAAAGLRIRTVLSVPTEATQSSPRRKVLVEADGHSGREEFLLLQGVCDRDKTLFSILKRCSHIPHEWLQSRMTVADMRRASQRRAAHSHPNPPMLVRFSPEIIFPLTIQPNCKGRVAGRICYRKILRPEDGHRKRGDRVTPLIERGLRHHTEAEVLAAVEYVALDERIVPAVVEDILDYYRGRLHELSLKTAWYCLRGSLLTRYGYREELVMQMLLDGGTHLAALPIGTSVPEDYSAALAGTFPEEEIPQGYWEQLHLILSAAREAEYIHRNPMDGYLTLVRARLSARQQEVRNELTKKHLELGEEQRMLEPFLDNRWMEEEPLAAAVLICMMAVPDLREAAALRWADLVPNGILGTYHFQITRFLAEDGTLRPTVNRGPEHCRCVPGAPFLMQILLEYKAHLMERYGFHEEELAVCPIILEDHRVLRKGIGKAKYCSPRAASETIRDHLASLEISSNEIVLPDGDQGKVSDLNRYHGNLLYTNLRHHLRHLCSCTEGELCCILGRKPPDTLSLHYCAYDHPVLQHRMALKLNRWAGKFPAAAQKIPVLFREYEMVGQGSLVLRGNGAELIHGNVTIRFRNAGAAGAVVILESRHGITGSVVVIKYKEETNHEE